MKVFYKRSNNSAIFGKTTMTRYILFRGKYKLNVILRMLEAVARRCSVKKVFLEISQNSQENTCARISLISYQKGDSGTGVFL